MALRPAGAFPRLFGLTKFVARRPKAGGAKCNAPETLAACRVDFWGLRRRRSLWRHQSLSEHCSPPAQYWQPGLACRDDEAE